jgi:hypothetical protein
VNDRPLFDRVVVVDWSASSTPTSGRDSVWIASFDAEADGVTANPATRHTAIQMIEQLASDGRVLLAVDFSLGYPRGTAGLLGLDGHPWSAMWEMLSEMVIDEVDNTNNRFEVAASLNARLAECPGPFWGRPATRPVDGLTTTKVSPTPLPEWRRIEQSLRDRGLRPFSSWQLLGAGAVGSQSILGIAALARLRRRLVELRGVDVEVWPFTSGLEAPRFDGGGCAIAEVWPSMLDIPVDDRVRDEAQVATVGAHLWRANVDGTLAPIFTPDVPVEHLNQVLDEEGWVLDVSAIAPG